MNTLDVLLLLCIGALVGAGTMSYLRRNQRGFEIFVAALNFISFLRCFGKWSEGAVEHELKERKRALQEALAHRDKVRAAWRIGGYETEDLPAGAMKVTWDRIETWVAESQMSYDYATGLAITTGFGKVAMKIANKVVQ